MPSRRSIATTALGALLLFPGSLVAQSIEISLPAFDVSVPSISVDTPGVADGLDLSVGEGATAQFNESDLDFIARSVEEATSGISEVIVTTTAGIAEDLQEMANALREVGEEVTSTMDELANIIVLCVEGGSCAPPDPPQPPPEP